MPGWIAAVGTVALAAAGDGNVLALAALVTIASMPLHECGHALAAALLGYRIRVARFGNGPTVVRLRIRSSELELRLVPLTGAVVAFTRRLAWLRLRVAVYAAAGVLLTLAVGVAVYRWASDDQRVALGTAGAIQVLNLLPIRFRVRGQEYGTDGSTIARAAFGPRATLHARFVAPLLRDDYLDEIARDPAAARATATIYDGLAIDDPAGAVMVRCADAAGGRAIPIGELRALWATSAPGWTDPVLAWCTDKTVRAAIENDRIDAELLEVAQTSITRVPEALELVETLDRVRAVVAPGSTAARRPSTSSD